MSDFFDDWDERSLAGCKMMHLQQLVYLSQECWSYVTNETWWKVKGKDVGRPLTRRELEIVEDSYRFFFNSGTSDEYIKHFRYGMPVKQICDALGIACPRTFVRKTVTGAPFTFREIGEIRINNTYGYNDKKNK